MTPKIVIIGDTNVGKSTLLKIADGEEFTNPDTFLNTVGVDLKILQVDNTKLFVWDTAGQERFRSISRSFYRGSVGVIIVFDLTSVESFNNVSQWIQDCQINMDAGYKTIIVGNKSDLPQAVPQERINQLTRMYYMDYFAVSATNRESIMVALRKLISMVPKTTYKDRLDVICNHTEVANRWNLCC